MQETDYRNFTSDDFLQDDSFIRWMHNVNADTKAWNSWVTKNADRATIIEDAQHKYQLLVAFNKQTISDKEQKQAWQKVARQIDYPATRVIYVSKVYWIRAIAACLLLGVLIFLYQTYYPGKEYTIQASNGAKDIMLTDGTHVILKNGTLKTYSKRSRQVWIYGQAYFEVNKLRNKSKDPVAFIVHADDFEVEVTGTVFTVNTDQAAKGVVLAEGHVNLSKGNKIVAMLPGEYVHLRGDTFIKEKVNTALYTAWKDKEFTFDNTSLNELKILVKNIYGLELTVTNEQVLGHRMLNGVVSIASLDVFIKTISVLLDADVKQSSGRLVISPKLSH